MLPYLPFPLFLVVTTNFIFFSFCKDFFFIFVRNIFLFSFSENYRFYFS